MKLNRLKKYTFIILMMACPNLWAMTHEEYLVLMGKVESNNASDDEVNALATTIYNSYKKAKLQKKELPESKQRALAILIQNGRYAQVLDDDIAASCAKYENGKLVQMPSTITLEYNFGTLGIIKTPESVRVCGKYLVEEPMRDHVQRSEQVTGECWTPNNAGGPSGYAAKALQNMGIKNAPAPTKIGSPVIALWQEWYDEVKSGARAFSFEGQEVAYRFKPDGTFESLDSKVAESLNQRITRTFTYDAMGRPLSTVSTAAGETTDKETKSDRNWVVFGALFVVLCVTYWFKFRRAGAKG